MNGVNHYMASAPPLHTMSTLQSPVTPNSNNTLISYISGNIPDSLTINNTTQKLSVSTQHSNESIDNAGQKPLTDDNRSDSLENRFIPPKLMTDHKQNGDIDTTDPKLNSTIDGNKLNGDAANNGSVFSIDNQIKNDEDYCYKNDPNYIKDINNPFLVGASVRASRRGLLEPIVRKDAYNVPPPVWSLAKNRKAVSEEKADGKKETEFHLQGVIGEMQ